MLLIKINNFIDRAVFKRGSLMRFIVCGFFILASLSSLLKETSAAEYPWKLRINKEEITVYTRKVEASPILEYKANMVIKVPLDKAIHFFEDIKNIPKWYYQCVQAELIQSDSPENIIYFVSRLPWPVTARDCVFSWIKSINQVSGEVIYTLHTVSGKFPEQKGRIRVIYIKSHWRFSPLKDGRTEVYFQQHSDPGGIIPVFLVNKLSVEIPFYSFKNFRKMIQESKN